MKKSTERAIKKIHLSTAEQRVVDFIAENGSITSLQAIEEIGETRISARIFELKEKGIPVTDEWLTVKNRFGENRRIKVYTIA